MLVGYVVKLTAITALYVYMYLDNKRRDRELSNDSEEDTIVAGIEGGMMVSQPTYLVCVYILTSQQDQTELENKAFRYVL